MRIEETVGLEPGRRVVSPYTTPPFRPLVVDGIWRNSARTRCVVTVRLGEERRSFPFEMVDWPPPGARWIPDRLAWCSVAGEQLLPASPPASPNAGHTEVSV